MTDVQLSFSELALAASVGTWRRIQNLRDKTPQQGHDCPNSDLWGQDIEGACAELAVCKALNVYWGAAFVPRGDRRRWDIEGLQAQVKWTKYKRSHLIVQPENPKDDPYILVIGEYGHYLIAGWCYGYEVTDLKTLKEGRRAVLAKPMEELRDITTIRPDTA